MSKEPLDIERMIMLTRYELSLSQEAAGRETPAHVMDYEKRIKDLLEAVSALLEANKAMGEKIDAEGARNKALEDEVAALQTKNSLLESQLVKLKGDLAQHKRSRFGKRSEKSPDKPARDKGKTKDESEDDYINNGNTPVDPGKEEAEEEKALEEGESPCSSKERDLSNRPDKYKTMHADLCVVHDCDLEKLKELGLTFVRYTRPVDQIDRISVTRMDRYLYVWVRDKDGNEFPFFVPKKGEEGCILNDEGSYDTPRIVPHTSATASMLADLVVNRYQYCISSGRELYRMTNEKLRMSPQTILNWLFQGAKQLEGPLKYIKRKLLKRGTAIYCDESWIDTKVVDGNGNVHYRRRYMWVIVNLTTRVCYYLFGNRSREVIEKFLHGFKGTLMTDAYVAYTYFGKLDECLHVCCWAHVRRLFVSALKDYKDKLAEEFIALIAILYKVELAHILHSLTVEEIVAARRQTSVPVLAELYQKAVDLLKQYDRHKVHFSEKLLQALKYMVNHWKELTGYVNCGEVQIDNNCCERAVRPFTNIRKSFGGFSSKRGGETTAAYLSFIETCKLLKKPPLDFFRRFFEMVVQGRRDYEAMTEALLC